MKEETLVTVSEVTLVKVANVVTVLKKKKEEKNLDQRTFFIKIFFHHYFLCQLLFIPTIFPLKKQIKGIFLQHSKTNILTTQKLKMWPNTTTHILRNLKTQVVTILQSTIVIKPKKLQKLQNLTFIIITTQKLKFRQILKNHVHNYFGHPFLSSGGGSFINRGYPV